jgi:hypothetical protein
MISTRMHKSIPGMVVAAVVAEVESINGMMVIR